MAAEPVPNLCILLRQASGVRKKGKGGKEQKIPYISKGELLAEIPKKEQVKQGEGTPPPHNFCLLRDSDITLYDNGTGVSPLIGPEGDYLEGIKDPLARLVEYQKEGHLQWITGLQHGDQVFFKLERHKGPQASLYPRGRVRYYGNVEGKKGVIFGIEITDPEHRGKGTTNGQPYFQCNYGDGVFVSMDKIIKQVDVPNKEDDPNTLINTQPKGGPPAHNTRSRMQNEEGKKEGFLNKAGKVLSNYLGGGGGQESPVDPPARPVVLPSQFNFSVGDRVVVQTARGKAVTGTVRWVGSIKAAGNVIVPAVGIETDRHIFPDQDFPEIHLDQTGSHGQCRFDISDGHSRLYLPEAMVLKAEEYAKQKQENNTFEAQEAKKWGMGVDEYREQMEMMRKAEDGKEKELDGRANQNPKPEEQQQRTEEERAAGTGDHFQDDPLPLLGPDESVRQAFPKERIEQEREELEKMKRERDFNRQHSWDQEHNQYSADQQPSAADRLREEHPALKTSPSMGRKGNNHDGASHPPHYHPNEGPSNYPPQCDYGSNRYQPGAHQPQELSLYPSGGDPAQPAATNDPSNFTLGTLVQIESHEGRPLYGTIRWMGTLQGYTGYYAGVELDYPMERCSNGSFDGVQYFDCPPGRGLFCLLTALQPDQRYHDVNQVPAAKRQDYKNPLAKKVPVSDNDDIPGDPVLFSQYIGDEHGIQGHHNSCYLDATVFGLFALSDSFDEMLLEEPKTEIGQKIKHILWKGIVNPLRKYGLARFESIMMLRDELENLGRIKGANTDEKDPEEFLNLLFKEILHVHPFISIKRPFGVEKEFFVQLFFEIDPKQSTLPSTEELIRKMFTEQQISFTSVPSKLLLQMPRFGKEFKMYNRIIPSLVLDIKPLLDPTSRGGQNCHLCRAVNATICCSTCATEVFRTEDSSVFFCEECSKRVHRERDDHKLEKIRVMGDVSMFSNMQLLSVICIETSHYVCFTRTNDRWLFHDSMANRVYDMYNIPRVTDVSQELNHWVYNPKNHKKLMQAPSKDVPECVRRFTQDIYMCVYINPNLDRYGGPDVSLTGTALDDTEALQSPDGVMDSVNQTSQSGPDKKPPRKNVPQVTEV